MTRRMRMLIVSALLAVTAVVGYATATAYGASHATPKVMHVTVTMTEFKFKLSVKKLPHVGTVIFKVVNKGKIAHDFKINGKKTKIVKPGKSVTLKVVFKKKGRYAYLCTIRGHAAAGMKGVLAVVVKPATTTKTTTTTAAATCTSPQASTVTVSEYEYGFDLSQTTVPCGTVTFKQSNTGQVTHNFDLEGVSGGVGALIDPGQTTSFTVTLVPGRYTYICDVSGHAQAGMVGALVVSG